MNYVSRIKIASLLVVFVTFVGCKSKQEKPPESTASPQEKAAPAPAAPAPVPSAAPAPNKPGALAVPPQDMAAVRAAAVRVLARLEAGDFAAIYKESAPSFKQIGSETAFVTKFQETRQKTGELKKPLELRFDTRPDNIHILVYRMENQRFITEVRLSFEREKNGTMELVGLNQHDEPKK